MDCRIWKSLRSLVAGTDPGPSGGGHGSSSIRPRANVSLVGMVNGKADLNTDVPFTLDGGTGRIDFIRCRGDGFCTIVFPKMHVHRIEISRSDGSEDCVLFFKITNRWYTIFVSDLGMFDLLKVHLFSLKISVLLLAYSLFLGNIHTASLVKAYWEE